MTSNSKPMPVSTPPTRAVSSKGMKNRKPRKKSLNCGVWPWSNLALTMKLPIKRAGPTAKPATAPTQGMRCNTIWITR